MARPNKTNLLYFPLDVDYYEDPKFAIIQEQYGVKGELIAIRIMALVYQTHGYYLEWPDNFEFVIAKRVGQGMTGALVMEIFRSCLKCGLFNQFLFAKYKVVTSTGIQLRWKRVMEDLRRKIVVKQAIWIVSSEETGINSEETGVNDTKSTQKENEEENEKENPVVNALSKEIIISGPERKKNAGRENFIPPSVQDVENYLVELAKDPGVQHPYTVNTWPPEKIKHEAEKLHKYYNDRDWTQGKFKNPIMDFTSVLESWIERENTGVFGPKLNGSGTNPIPKKKVRKTLCEVESDINSAFEQFRFGKCGFANTHVKFYDHLREKGMLDIFNDNDAVSIEALATDEMNRMNMPASQEIKDAVYKKAVVLHYFNKRGMDRQIFEMN